MEYANVREMHQPSAVGVTREASVDDGGLYITVEVVDEGAWEKVKRGVYKGFSIGAKITERDSVDRSTVRGIKLREISLVDRPADPGAKIDLWHADGVDEDEDDIEHRDFTTEQRQAMAKSGEAMSDGSFPIANRADLENAIRAYGRAKNKRAVRRHIIKRARALGATDLIPEDWNTMTRAAEADAQEDQAERADGAETITAEAGAEAVEGAAAADAEVEHADGAEAAEGEGAETADPVARAVEAAQAALQKADEAEDRVERVLGEDETAERVLDGGDIRRGLGTVARLGYLLSEMAYIVSDAQFEAEIEGDNSPVPGKLRGALLEMAKAYKAMSDEELSEFLKGVGVDVALENGIIALMCADGDLERAEGEVSAELGERLQGAFDAFVRRGLVQLPEPVEPTAAPAELEDLRRAVETGHQEREVLLRTMGDLTERVIGLADTVGKVADALPAPSKTAGVFRAVGKGEDAAGAGSHQEDVERGEPLSQEDVKRALEAMPAEQRADILIRAAIARPIALSHRRASQAAEA